MFKIILSLGYCGDFNLLRRKRESCHGKLYKFIYKLYLLRHSSFIPISCHLGSGIIFPHLSGIFIASEASVGDNCIIYQHVTIGSTYYGGSRKIGAQKIGSGCVIGAGAKIIGDVTVGENCKIGANCVVVDDVPDGCTVVAQKPRIIINK